MLKITIITVAFNSIKTIKETIESVISQTYGNVEYIIIDGKSSDGTQELVAEYGSKITTFISEKDNGLYHAMNKGIDIATGDVIGILNSDDLYENNAVLSTVMQEFDRTQVDCLFGDLYYFKTSNPNKIVRHYSGKDFKVDRIKFGFLPPHPTFFVKREVYQKFGKFDLQFKYAADFDLMVRFLCVHQRPYSYLQMKMVKMRLGGISTGSFKRIIEINREDIMSCKKNGIHTNFLMFHFKYFVKVLGIRSFASLINN